MLSKRAQNAVSNAVADEKSAVEVLAKLNANQAQAAAVVDIADPTVADAEEVANKVNAILAALRTAGLMAE